MVWRNLHPEPFVLALKLEKNYFLIDVRTASECAEGIIENSLHLDVGRNDIVERLLEIPKEKSIFIYCQHGIRSMQVCRFLESKAYPKLFNLIGGYHAYRTIFNKTTT